MKNIYVGNLPFRATEHDLRALFEPFGTVDRTTVIADRETGRSRGFGFVEMPADADGERAIQSLDGTDYDGRSLRVNEARPRGGGERGPDS